MKKSLLIVACVLIILIGACKKEEKDPNKEIPPHNFLSQNMSGKVNDTAWSFKIGRVQALTVVLHEITFIDSTLHTDSCGANSNILLGTAVPYPIKPGLYAIKENVRNFDIRYNQEIIRNFVGALEITSVNEDTKLVTGKIDVRKDDKNYLNGNFTVKLCPNL